LKFLFPFCFTPFLSFSFESADVQSLLGSLFVGTYRSDKGSKTKSSVFCLKTLSNLIGSAVRLGEAGRSTSRPITKLFYVRSWIAIAGRRWERAVMQRLFLRENLMPPLFFDCRSVPIPSEIPVIFQITEADAGSNKAKSCFCSIEIFQD
jgi:hypothetical protein